MTTEASPALPDQSQEECPQNIPLSNAAKTLMSDPFQSPSTLRPPRRTYSPVPSNALVLNILLLALAASCIGLPKASAAPFPQSEQGVFEPEMEVPVAIEPLELPGPPEPTYSIDSSGAVLHAPSQTIAEGQMGGSAPSATAEASVVYPSRISSESHLASSYGSTSTMPAGVSTSENDYPQQSVSENVDVRPSGAAATVPAPLFNRLYLIPLVSIIVLGSAIWLYLRIKRNKRDKAGALREQVRRSFHMDYKPCDDDDRSELGSTKDGPEGFQAFTRLEYDRADFQTGQGMDGLAQDCIANPGRWSGKSVKLQSENRKLLRYGGVVSRSDAPKAHKIIVQAPTPQNTWGRSTSANAIKRLPVHKADRVSIWRRIFGKGKNEAKGRITDPESFVAGRPYGSMGHAETGVSPRFLTRPTESESRLMLSRSTEAPQLTYEPLPSSPLGSSISSSTKGASYDSTMETVSSPVMSAISQYNKETSLIASYYYSSAAATLARTRRAGAEDDGVMSPLLEEDVADVRSQNACMEICRPTPIFIRSNEISQCLSPRGFGPLISPPPTSPPLISPSAIGGSCLSVEALGLRIITETPSPPTQEPLFVPLSQAAPQCAGENVGFPFEAEYVAKVKHHSVTARNSMRGPRLLIRRNPDRKKVEYNEVLVTATHSSAAPEEGSHRSRRKKHSGQGRSIRMPTGGRPAPSHVKRHSAKDLSDIFAMVEPRQANQ